MANKNMIADCIEEFAVNFNRNKDYTDIMYGRWLRSFRDTPDKCLAAGLQKILTTNYQYPPTLGTVVEAVQKEVADLLGRVGSGVTVKDYSFCPNCKERKGIIETAAHYIKDEKLIVSCKANLCGCEGSKEYNGTDMRLWTKRRELLQNDERVELLDFFYTDEHHPHLKGVDQHGQYFDHTMQPDLFLHIQDLVSKRRKGILPATSYSKAVEVLVNADKEVLEGILPSTDDVIEDDYDYSLEPWDISDELDYD